MTAALDLLETGRWRETCSCSYDRMRKILVCSNIGSKGALWPLEVITASPGNDHL